MWTEAWSGWFTAFGKPVPHRPVEDLAFAVARFIQKGGSFVNYYMVSSVESAACLPLAGWLDPAEMPHGSLMSSHELPRRIVFFSFFFVNGLMMLISMCFVWSFFFSTMAAPTSTGPLAGRSSPPATTTMRPSMNTVYSVQPWRFQFQKCSN